jgi:dTDP-4-dehydrorhamnose 3,5-epimerase
MKGFDLPYGIEFTRLKKIDHPKGDLFHALKASEPSFKGFGEAYFTTVNVGETKGWKLHQKMVLNIVVILGEVKFHFCNGHSDGVRSFSVGSDNYGRLTIPAGVWVAFSGVGEGINLVLNLASIEHDPNESINAPLERFSVN